MDALEAIKTRRSTRIFKEDMPPRELLDKIIEAGRYAPSGHNSQTTHLIVITDKKIHEEITAVVKDALSKMEAGPDTYVSLKYAIEASKKDGYAFNGLPERTPLERKGNPVTWVGSDDL